MYRKLLILQSCCKYLLTFVNKARCCADSWELHDSAASSGASCGSPSPQERVGAPVVKTLTSFMLEDVLVIASHVKLLETPIQCSLDVPLHVCTSGCACDLAGGSAIQKILQT